MANKSQKNTVVALSYAYVKNIVNITIHVCKMHEYCPFQCKSRVKSVGKNRFKALKNYAYR